MKLVVNPVPAISVDSPVTATSVSFGWNLLLAALSAEISGLEPDRVPRLIARQGIERPADWETVLRLADEHGLSSLLYQHLSRLSGAVPVPVLASLRQRYEASVRRSLFLARELIRILGCLEALGIDATPYKGPALSQIYYGDMAMRQSGDIDIFVRKGSVARIKDAVRDLGYMPRLPIPLNAEDDYIASGYECTFDSPAEKNLLEVQWALQPRFYAVDYDMDGMFGRAVTATLADRSIQTPSPEDLLLVLSIHAAKHAWERLIWLCDIAQILKRDHPNWDWVQSQARELGVERILHITLLLTNRFLENPIPGPIETAIASDGAAQLITNEIAIDIARGVSYDVERLSYFRFMLRLRERRRDRLRFLLRLTLTPGPGEWQAIRLPQPLFPLYRLVRLGRLASRFARQ